jgi:hypothetical protein
MCHLGSGHRLLRLALVARVVVDTFRSPVARTHVHAHEGHGDGVTRTRSPEFFGVTRIFGGQQRQYARDAHAHARTHECNQLVVPLPSGRMGVWQPAHVWSYRCRQGVWVCGSQRTSAGSLNASRETQSHPEILGGHIQPM